MSAVVRGAGLPDEVEARRASAATSWAKGVGEIILDETTGGGWCQLLV